MTGFSFVNTFQPLAPKRKAKRSTKLPELFDAVDGGFTMYWCYQVNWVTFSGFQVLITRLEGLARRAWLVNALCFFVFF